MGKRDTRALLGLALSVAMFCGVAHAAKTYVVFPSLRAPTSIPALMTRPAGDERAPAVVVLRGCAGEVYDEWSEFLSAHGYVALVVDTLDARNFKSCTPPLAINTLNALQAEDAYGALDYLTTLPFVDTSRVAVMGVSEAAMTVQQSLLPETARRALQSRTGATFAAAIALDGGCGDKIETNLPLLLLVSRQSYGACSAQPGRGALVAVEDAADGVTSQRAHDVALSFLNARLK